MTIKEIEAACDAGRPPAFSRHHAEAPDLTLAGMFYPLGFPMELRTNCAEVLKMASEQFGMFEKQHNTKPVSVSFHVTEGGATECPTPPVHRFTWPMRLTISDPSNYCIFEMEQNRTIIAITREAMQHRDFVKSEFLAGAPGPHLVMNHITPVHAACVEFDGHAVLLCGDTGAGKSTLSYASAKAGWTYITDDGSFLLNEQSGRRVIGNCYKVRFRPETADLFPELQNQELTPRWQGKPSIELPTSMFPHMTCTQTARVDFMVFLNRHSGGQHELVPYRKDVARCYLSPRYGSQKSRAVASRTIEQLLAVDTFELRYTDLDWAVSRLKQLVKEGR